MKTQVQASAIYDICAAHKLARPDWDDAKNAEVFGHCARLHGHQYRLEVTVEGPINQETGMVINLYDVDKVVKDKIFVLMDHHYLNDSVPFFKDHLPTAEWIAYWVYHELKGAFPKPIQLSHIRLYETTNLYVEYRGE